MIFTVIAMRSAAGRPVPRALAALLQRNFLAEHAGGVVPLERLGVIARHPGESLVVDVPEPLRRLAVAGARRAHIELDRVVALALLAPAPRPARTALRRRRGAAAASLVFSAAAFSAAAARTAASAAAFSAAAIRSCAAFSAAAARSSAAFSAAAFSCASLAACGLAPQSRARPAAFCSACRSAPDVFSCAVSPRRPTSSLPPRAPWWPRPFFSLGSPPARALPPRVASAWLVARLLRLVFRLARLLEREAAFFLALLRLLRSSACCFAASSCFCISAIFWPSARHRPARRSTSRRRRCAMITRPLPRSAAPAKSSCRRPPPAPSARLRAS